MPVNLRERSPRGICIGRYYNISQKRSKTKFEYNEKAECHRKSMNKFALFGLSFHSLKRFVSFSFATLSAFAFFSFLDSQQEETMAESSLAGKPAPRELLINVP